MVFHRPRAPRRPDRRLATRPRRQAPTPAVGRIALEAAHDHALDRRIEIADDRRRRRQRPAFVRFDQIGGGLGFERAPARENFEQDETERIEVALDRRLRHAVLDEQFGRHVLRCAGVDGVRIVGRDREAEIGDPCVAGAVDHHVRGFEIAMEDAAVVRRGQPGADLTRELDRLVLRKAPDPPEQRREIFAVDILHREEPAAVRLAQVVQAADVLVRHLARDTQLVVELRQVHGVGGDGVGQEFQGNGMVERQVLGAVHLAHAALAEQRHEPVAPGDNGSRCEAVRRRRRPPRAGEIRDARFEGVGCRAGRTRRLRHVGNSTGGTHDTQVVCYCRGGDHRGRARGGQGGRPASPAGTAETQVGGKYVPRNDGQVYQGGKWIEIIYSRPIKRGRDLFGSGANYGKTVNPDAPVWRAGANQTTQLKTEVPLVINGKTVPVGTYTMFIDLKPNNWTLIVSRWEAQKDFDENNKTQLFGAYGYTPDKDVARAPMTMGTLPFSADQLTWQFLDMSDTGGKISIMWDKIVASTPFKVGT